MLQMKLSDVSKCLTNEVISNAFMQKTNSKDKVKVIELSRAAAPGEGLLSVVYRIHVTGHKHTATFIVKGLVNNLQLRKSLMCTEYFAREGKFFTDILPALVDIQKSCGANESIQDYIPKFYSCCLDGENDYILLEDLAAVDCKSASEHPTRTDRDKALKTLAHYHAVSIALRIKKPDLFKAFADSIPELFFAEYNRNWYLPYQKIAIELDREVVKEFFETSSDIYKKFDNVVSNDPFENILRTLDTSSEHLVICHGDAWCPNFLFSKDKAMVIDFQLMRCASLATDLSYLIMLCSHLCQNKQDFMVAVEVYYTSLSFYMKDMGFEPSQIFSRETLDEELKKYGRFGFLASLTSIPLMAGERFDTVTSEVVPVPGEDRLPLESLWKLSPIKDEHKSRLVNSLRVNIDLGLI